MAKGGKGGDGGAGEARAAEAKRQEDIRTGTSKINDTFNGQFNDDFFNQRQNAYLDYSTPQLNDQYTKAQKELAFSLDRSHLTDSSVRAAKEAELRTMYDTARRNVADQGLGYANQARSNVEEARGNLISTLNATGDVAGAVNSATARAKALSAPDTYSPLAQFFTTFTSGLGQQAANEKNNALLSSYSAPSSGVNLFGSNKNSVVTS